MVIDTATTETLQNENARLHDRIAELEATLRQQARIIAQMPGAVVVTDMDGFVVSWSRGAEHLYGYNAAEMIGRHLALLYPSGEYQTFLHCAIESLQTRDSHELELRMRSKSGNDISLCVSLTQLRDENNRPCGIMSSARASTTCLCMQQELYALYALAESLPDGVIIATLDGKLTYANPATRTMLKYDDGLVGMLLFDILDEDPSYVRALICQATRQGSWHGHLTHRRKDGSTLKGKLSIATIYDEYGQPQALSGIFRDITRQMQTEATLEAALHQSQTLLLEVIDNLPAAIFVRDLTGKYLLTNHRFPEIMGFNNEQTMGASTYELFPPTIARSLCEHDHYVLKAEQPLEREIALPLPDGEHVFLEIKFPLYDEQGTIYAIGGVATDITERKQAERDLSAAYERLTDLNEHLCQNRDLLRAIFDSLEDGLLLLDGTGNVQLINRALITLLDSTADILIGQSWKTLYQAIAPDFPGHLALHPPTSGRNCYERIRYHRPNGTTHILDIRIIVLHRSDRTIKQVIMHVVDVTERVQLQERLIAIEGFAASGRLAASVAHEINTPLQSVQTFLELAGIATDEDRATFLLYAQEETQRMGRIVHQLLDFYRPNVAVPGPVAVNNLIERLLLLMNKRLMDQHIKVEQNLALHLPPLWGRADELTQVLLNLMINALDAMPNGGTIWIQTALRKPESGNREENSQGGNEVLIAISDSGCGINPTLQTRIFEPFVTTKKDGTGLGLSISLAIVRQHRGSITLNSQPGKGSTFTILLPCTPALTEDRTQ